MSDAFLMTKTPIAVNNRRPTKKWRVDRLGPNILPPTREQWAHVFIIHHLTTYVQSQSMHNTYTHIVFDLGCWHEKGYEAITAHILKGNTIVGYLLTERQALGIVKTAAAAAGTTNIPLFRSLVAVEKSTRTYEFTKEEDNVPVFFSSKKNTQARESHAEVGP